jgi:hypothetical protein
MIKCEECGHDNPLGSIFCRECGEKLDIDNIKPSLQPKAKANIVNLVRNIIGGIIFLIVLYVVASMAVPEAPINGKLDEDAQKVATQKLDSLLAKIKGKFGDEKYVFSPDEVTYLYNTQLTQADDTENTSYETGDVYFSLWGEQVIVLMQSTFLGMLPVSFSVKGTIPEDSTDLFILNAKVGHYSVPSFLKNMVIKKFHGVTAPSSVQDVLKGVSSFTIEDGQFVVHVE